MARPSPNDAVPLAALLEQREFVRRLALALTGGDDARADDVAQETMVRALSDAQPPVRAGVSGWLAGIARNVLRSDARAAGRRRRREQAVARGEALPSPAEQAERLETMERLARAIAELPEGQRTAILLRYYDGLPPARIAKSTGESVTAVKSRLARGLARLRERLGRPDPRATGDRRLDRGLFLLAALPAAKSSFAATAAATGALLMSGKLLGGVAAAAVLVAVLISTKGPPDTSRPAPDPDGTIAESEFASRASAPEVRSEEPVRSGTAPKGPVAEGEEGRPPAETAAAGTREGFVIGPDGRPLAGAGVTFGASRTESDADGRFLLPADLPAAARITVQATGFATAQAFASGAPLRVRLEPEMPIAGRVVEAGSARPVGRILILVKPAGATFATPVVAATDGEGRFRVPGLAPGEYEVTFGAQISFDAGGEFVSRTILVKEGATDLLVELERGLSIEGRILNVDGEAAGAGHRVRLVPILESGRFDYERQRFVVTTDEGAFAIRGLPAGHYHLAVVPADAQDGVAFLERSPVSAGETGLVLQMAAGRPLRGRLVDERGEPVAGEGAIYVTPAGRRAGAAGTVMAQVGEDGRFETAPLEFGSRWDVFATGFAGHHPGQAKSVEPGAGEVVIELRTARRIVGLVRDPAGQPVGAGVPVLAVDKTANPREDGAFQVAYTTAGGRFAVDELGDRIYTLVAGGQESGYAQGPERAGVRPGDPDVELRVAEGETLSGRLTTPDGGPARPVRVVAFGTDSAYLSPMAKVGEDGAFTLRGLKRGPVQLHAFLGDRYVPLGTFAAPATDLTIPCPER